MKDTLSFVITGDIGFDKYMKDRHGKYIVFCSNL